MSELKEVIYKMNKMVFIYYILFIKFQVSFYYVILNSS